MNYKYSFIALAFVLGVPVPAFAGCENTSCLGHKQIVPPATKSRDGKVSLFQVKTGLGWSDNVNRGVDFDELTFGSASGLQVTLPLSEQSKAQEGSWHDTEVVYRNVVPPKSGVDGSFQLGANWRDYHDNNRLDLGVLSAQASVRLKGIAPVLDPRFVVLGDAISLGGEAYREDMGVGVQLQPKMKDKKLTVRYSVNDSNYQKIDNSDGSYHKLNISMPELMAKKNMRVDVETGYQWPNSVEPLLDYREASLKVRLRVKVTSQQAFTSSYAISKQQDQHPYNETLFGDQKRDLQQQEIGIGWEWQASNRLAYECKLQQRKADAGIKLFEHSATDATVSMRWKMN